MITLKTITTIELSSLCNLKCLYCISRLLVKHPDRKPGIMEDHVFDLSLIWLSRLCEQGTQREVNLNGNGESCLDPQLVSRIRRVKEIMGDRPVAFSSNGVNMTEVLAKQLKGSGIDRIDLSPHSAYHARRAAYILNAAGITGIINMGAIISAHNWAGQLEPEHSIDCQIKIQCDPLIEGRGYISSEGNISPCCFDYRNLGMFGTVFDPDLLDREIRPYALCDTCHQVIPDYILSQKEA